MTLNSMHALGFRAAHEAMAETLRQDGADADYSVASLGRLERFLDRFARHADEPSALTPEGRHRLLFRAGAYAAEVLLRAVRGADVSLDGGELVLTLPSDAMPGMTFKAYPRLRVAKVLDGEERLLDWAVVLLAMTARASAGAESD
jgi:hypothetical protein